MSGVAVSDPERPTIRISAGHRTNPGHPGTPEATARLGASGVR